MTNQYQKRIKADPKVLAGKPIIKGTRIAVEFVLRLLAQGMTEKEILENYTHLKKEDIKAVLEYAAQVIGEEQVFPLIFPKTHKYA
ncbi:MAG: DUF433 domain-containing protein [Parcubacteria group bacterium]|nr:DUF433 domain-containing protein [Parcubacteria group bacterium]